ncbi:MAG TPA: hypothetical protein VNL35_07620 [Chloroflexota bacterium]|nr:hypothetical protein [Chloroflexota bacterium]
MQDPRIEAALQELRTLILTRYPTAAFLTFPGDDPAGMYLRATVEVEDTDEVVDVIIDRLLAMQVDEGLPVYVIPVRAA